MKKHILPIIFHILINYAYMVIIINGATFLVDRLTILTYPILLITNELE